MDTARIAGPAVSERARRFTIRNRRFWMLACAGLLFSFPVMAQSTFPSASWRSAVPLFEDDFEVGSPDLWSEAVPRDCQGSMGGGGPIHVTGDVTKPVKIFAPPPEYTEMAERARVQGVVILQAIIDCNGRVLETTVLKGLPMGLSEQAQIAVANWRFRPAMLQGEPVSVYFNLTINFQLDN